MTDKTNTTAAYLGQYRRELKDAGIPECEVDVLVRDAALHILADQGITVGEPDTSASSIKIWQDGKAIWAGKVNDAAKDGIKRYSRPFLATAVRHIKWGEVLKFEGLSGDEAGQIYAIVAAQPGDTDVFPYPDADDKDGIWAKRLPVTVTHETPGVVP